MARKQEKSKAIELRLQGWSYTQIKKELGISKSTLSGWLHDYPLSEERIKELQSFGSSNPQRIERYRKTRRIKREKEEKQFLNLAKAKIRNLNHREKFIAGMFLYWGEGGKTERYSVSFSNTNPTMIKFFMSWLNLLNVKKTKIKIRLHLYKDMDRRVEERYWSELLDIPLQQFTKPYIKDSLLSTLTYKNGFGHGTCNVYYHNKETAYLVRMGLKYIESLYQ